jgi:hypothetical protein
MAALLHLGSLFVKPLDVGLVLALESGQSLMLKYVNWKSNAYRAFS